ncbi:hypothetical protein Dsin_026270 [Dipteronia sinensis]|uniref:DUF4704 domain-containing protein n=1 Tax=Dipteronia sinensis TaxID=43782 RepID=A0AAD9ZX87_9ROSI|nr:hypothetical protein Dsin_026270 [Dipteronia sinensis]
MQDANAIQMHLDGCRRCYWVIHEKDSLNTFSLDEDTRPVGEVNALVDELLVVVELIIGATPPSLAMDDVHRLLGFLVDCPQPNQVARVLHLIYRLVVHPNTARAQTFAEAFISSGGIESLLVLLPKEAKAGDHSVPESMTKIDGSLSVQDTELESDTGILERSKDDKVGSQESDMQGKDFESLPLNTGSGPVTISAGMNIERMSSVSEYPFIKNLGGISHSNSADNARNNVYNIDKSDGHLKFGSHAPLDMTSNFGSIGLHDRSVPCLMIELLFYFLLCRRLFRQHQIGLCLAMFIQLYWGLRLMLLQQRMD